MLVSAFWHDSRKKLESKLLKAVVVVVVADVAVVAVVAAIAGRLVGWLVG